MCGCPITSHKMVWLPLCLTPSVEATNTSHLCGCHYASHSQCGCHYASHPCSVVATMPHTETVANLLDTIIPEQRVQTFRQWFLRLYHILTSQAHTIMLNHLLTSQLYSGPLCDRCTVPPYNLEERSMRVGQFSFQLRDTLLKLYTLRPSM